MSIHFFSENIDFNLKNKKPIRIWLNTVAQKEHSFIGTINFIFCSDNFLLKLNQEHLNHNTLTDIITFDYTDSSLNIKNRAAKNKSKNPLSGDIFISIPRVKENASSFQNSFKHELSRVMVHGLLHLLGYKDKKIKDKKMMREKENFYLEFQLPLV